MLGLNEIENGTHEIGFNPNMPSVIPRDNNYIIPGLNDSISIPPPAPQGVYDQLNDLFSEQDKQQKTIQETREILGESAKDLSDEQVYDLSNEIQYLVDSWLEEYEKEVFEGKTLDELIKI